MTQPWIFVCAGGVVVLLALILIYRGTPVTSGHAVLVGFGGALMALPVVADFEWTDSGFKFTTKAESSELAKQVASLVQEDISIRNQLTGIVKASQELSSRISAVERASAENSSSFQPPPIDQLPYTQPGFLNQLERQNLDANSGNEKQLENIQTLQEKLTPNVAQDRLFMQGVSR